MWHAFVQNLVNVLLYIPRQIWSYMVDAVLYLLNLVPPFITDTHTISQVLSAGGGLGYFLDLAAADYGFPLMIGALVARFVLRRIPLIGG